MCLRLKATIIPSPTHTSAAATAITEIAKTCPSTVPKCRENATRARFDELSMISSESSMISGLRRSTTPVVPIAKRTAATARYQVGSGPSTTPPAPRRS
jgi:hypothetical protein